MRPKQVRFVAEYLLDLNATQAAIRAGYSRRSAAVIGHENIRKPQIAAAVAAAQQAEAETCGITRQYVLERLRANLERAMQAEPVLDNAGKPTGEYRYEGAVANRAAELLGKHLGMFEESIRLPDLRERSDAELAEIAHHGKLRLA